MSPAVGGHTIVRVTALVAFFLIPMVLGFWAQHRVKSTFAKNLQVPVSNGMTGAQVARRVLDERPQRSSVEETPGTLSDHYDPQVARCIFRRTCSTGPPSHRRPSVRTRSGMRSSSSPTPSSSSGARFPAVQFASNIWMLFLLGGLFLNILGFLYLAIALYAVAVLFQFVALPVEFDALEAREATARARRLQEADGVQATLNAADVRRRRPRRCCPAPVLPHAAEQPLAVTARAAPS